MVDLFTPFLADEEPSSRIEIGDTVVLVVWVAREFVAHAQGQRQVVSGAPGIDEVPTQHVSEQLPGGIAADGLAADGKTEQEIGERPSRGAKRRGRISGEVACEIVESLRISRRNLEKLQSVVFAAGFQRVPVENLGQVQHVLELIRGEKFRRKRI